MRKVIFDFNDFIEIQKKLDSYIFNKKNIDYQSTVESRKLALLVELAEFINETKSFKFWSNSQEPAWEKLLMEYIDILHFTISTAISFSTFEKHQQTVFEYIEYDQKKSNEFLINYFLNLYQNVTEFLKEENFMQWIKEFLAMGSYLGLKYEQIKECYLKKVNINFQRQDNNY